MTAFDFDAEAELFSNRTKSELLAARPRTRRRDPIGYGRFARASDAIRFAVEELTPGPPSRHLPRSRGGEVRRRRDPPVVRKRKISAGPTGRESGEHPVPFSRNTVARREAPVEEFRSPRLGACAVGLALGQSRTHSRRALQRRAPRGARAEPRGRAAGDGEADQRSSAGGPARRQRSGAARLRIAPSPRRSTRAARSRRRRNGCSTTIISSRSRFARSAPICRPATTGSCRSSPTGRSPAIRACSAWPGPSSPTPTAASIPRCCAASCAPTRRSSR